MQSSPSQQCLSQTLNLLTLRLAAVAMTAGAVTAFGASPTLSLIPTIPNPGNDYVNEGRAITSDGKYVVGLSGVGTSGAPDWGTWIGFLYNADSGTSVNPTNPTQGTYSCILTGVGYRTNSGVRELVMDGWDNSVYQAQWMTPDGGITWGAKRRNTSIALGSSSQLYYMAPVNSLGTVGTNSVYHVIFRDASMMNLYTVEGSNSWPASCSYASKSVSANTGGMNTLASLTGRAAGYFRPSGGVRHNFVVEYPIKPSDTNWFNGLDGTANGEAFALSADGTVVFGVSPLNPSTGTTNYGYRAVLTGRASTLASSSVHMLPIFANTTGSLSLAIPYGCTSNGLYAVGMSYRGVETAVLWDTSNADYTKWTVMDLYQYAVSWGIQGGFTSLNRAYSCGMTTNGDIAITGFGNWSPDGGTTKYKRAFRMTVPPQGCGGADVGGIATPVYDNATTVTVTGCDPTATAVKVYHIGVELGSAAGGSASVAVPVSSLVAGWPIRATQVVNAQESCLASAPGATVISHNPPPVVVLTAPANNALFWTPANIGLEAAVTSNGNTINYVGFYQGATLIANVTNPPYACVWSNVLAGSYGLSARAVYNSVSNVTSTASSITVSNSAQVSTLTVIPLVPWTFASKNQGRAISPDAKYVVGACYNSSMGDDSDGGFLYDVNNGALIQPGTNCYPAAYRPGIMTGIGYRTDSTYGKQLILHGMSGGYQAVYSTLDGGLSWAARLLDSSHSGFGLPVANSLGAVTGSDVFYAVIGNHPADLDNQRELHTFQGSGVWSATGPCIFLDKWFYIDNPDGGNMCGVAGATGRAVGWYRDNYTYQPAQVVYNCVVEYPPPGSIGYPASYANTWFFRGLANTNLGEAWSVSSDGNRIFGRSPTPTDSNWHGYKAIVTSATSSLQSITQLPDFPDTGGSTRLATPYGCSADGRYAVGMNYRGGERAVLWDTGGASPANWTVVDLTERAAYEGILGNFTLLYRAFSVGTNSTGSPVITGVGTYDDGSGPYNRAFVMVVGTPRPRITAITGAGTSSVTVNYANIVAGKTYYLQYNTNLNSPSNWYPVGTKTATGTTDSQTQNSVTPGPRYYRVWYTP